MTENRHNPSSLRPASRVAQILYLVPVVAVFAVLTVVFVFFPRSRYSELEKRELASFPKEIPQGKTPADYTAAISQWFSDSEPFRDEFMTLSMNIRNHLRYTGNADEAVTFHPVEEKAAPAAVPGQGVKPKQGKAASGPTDGAPEEFDNSANASDNAKVGGTGTVVVGSGENVRALMTYGSTPVSGKRFAEVLNEYAAAFPSQNVYAVPVPIATEFYLPAKAQNVSSPQQPTIARIKENLSADVKFVNVYSVLADHVDEPIFLRTDHHWAPLGAYYAAERLAKVAGVPFRDLSSYEKHTLHNFVGSMYAFSKDISVKNAPEDFVYYTPKGVEYKSTYRIYDLDENYQITGEHKPTKSSFFKHFRDGSSAAYCTFMGTDQTIVKVETSTTSGRRLLIIKDSYGNAVPGYLFYSFGEIHVVDFRYFTHNIKRYVEEHGITDIAVIFNIFNVSGKTAPNKIHKFLTQADSTPAVTVAKPSVEKKSSSDSVKSHSAAIKPENSTDASASAISDTTAIPDIP